MGEKCGYDRSRGGLFSPAATNAPAVLPYSSSNAKRESGKAKGKELEHPIPGAALRARGQGSGYPNEYTVPTPYNVHRAAVGGGGGGISSTGSSTTAKGWAAELAAQPNEYEVVRMSLTDQINAYLGQNAFNEEAEQSLADWLEAQHSQAGRITEAQRDSLLNRLINRFYDQH